MSSKRWHYNLALNQEAYEQQLGLNLIREAHIHHWKNDLAHQICGTWAWDRAAWMMLHCAMLLLRHVETHAGRRLSEKTTGSQIPEWAGTACRRFQVTAETLCLQHSWWHRDSNDSEPKVILKILKLTIFRSVLNILLIFSLPHMCMNDTDPCPNESKRVLSTSIQ